MARLTRAWPCSGAAIGTIQGLGEVEPPLHLSQGYTLDLRPQATPPPLPLSPFQFLTTMLRIQQPPGCVFAHVYRREAALSTTGRWKTTLVQRKLAVHNRLE